MTETSAFTGTILHLQRLSTEDGPGIRTTVFFKGCPLHCAWCHNPESLSLKAEVQWIGSRCIGCESCMQACEQDGLTRDEMGIHRDRVICTVCGRCVDACPSGAMEMLGREITVAGTGERTAQGPRLLSKNPAAGLPSPAVNPSLQPRFAAALMRALKQEGIHVALDTCGLCSPEVMRDLATLADLILFDLKLLDSAEHKRWTGVDNTRILENLELVRGLVQDSGGTKALWIRTPLIPGATTAQGNIQAIGAYLGKRLNGSVAALGTVRLQQPVPR